MKEEYIAIGLSETISKIYGTKLELETFQQDKKIFEKKLYDPKERIKYIKDAILLKSENLKELKINKKQDKIDVLSKEIETYKSYLNDDTEIQNIFKKIIKYIDIYIEDKKENINKYCNIKVNDIKFVISKENFNKENINEWIEKETKFNNYPEEMKKEINQFINELWHSNKIFTYNKDKYYLVETGIFKTEEFEKIIKKIKQSRN